MGNRINEVKINKSEIKGIDKEINKKIHNIYKSICKITYKKEVCSCFLIKLPKDGFERLRFEINDELKTVETLLMERDKILLEFPIQKWKMKKLLMQEVKKDFMEKYKNQDLH